MLPAVRAGVPLDLRHVLSGECSEGVTAEERARAVALLGGLGAALPLRAALNLEMPHGEDTPSASESQRATIRSQ